MSAHLNHHNDPYIKPVSLIIDNDNHSWQSFCIANLLLADKLIQNNDDNSLSPIQFGYMKSSLSYKFATHLSAAGWSVLNNFWQPCFNYHYNDHRLPLLEYRKSSSHDTWLSGCRIRSQFGNIMIPCSSYFKLHYWSCEKLFLLHPFNQFLFDDHYQLDQTSKFGVVLFNDLPSYTMLASNRNVAGFICRLRLRVSKLRTDLKYRHLPIPDHAGLSDSEYSIKCPLCIQVKLLEYESIQRQMLGQLFGHLHPFLNQLLPSSLNNVGRRDQLLNDLMSVVDDDSLEHLLFKCPLFDVYRTAYDIPVIVNNDNMKLLLGQVVSSTSRWKQLESFYKSIFSLRPDLF